MPPEINKRKAQEETTQGEVLKAPMKEPRKTWNRRERTTVPATAIIPVDSISLRNKPKNKDVYDEYATGEITETDPKQGDTPKLTGGMGATALVVNGDADSAITSGHEDLQSPVTPPIVEGTKETAVPFIDIPGEKETVVLKEQNPTSETTQPITAVLPKEEMTATTREQAVNNPPASDSSTHTKEEKNLADTKHDSTPATKDGETIIFVENKEAADIPKSTSEDPHEYKEDEESDDEYIPPTAEETRQNDTEILAEGIEITVLPPKGDIDSEVQSPSEDYQNGEDEEDEAGEGDEDDYIPTPQQIEEERQNALKKQVHFQIALNLFTALKNRKLQTLDRNATAHVKNYLPPNATEQDAKTILLESIKVGLNYWNRNEWKFTQNSLVEELELVIICQDIRIRPRHNQERARQEILSYFNLL